MAESLPSFPVNQAQYNALPAYYTGPAQDFSGFIQDYLAKMNAPGGYSSGYDQARVAGQDPYQSQAYSSAGGLMGATNPYTSSGAATMQNGQGMLGSAYNYTNTTPTNTFDNAGNMLNSQYGSLNGMDPYVNAGAGALGQASSFIGGSATYDPNVMQQHLNPYMSGVNDEIARLGNQNLMENVLPGVNSTFTGAGQFGSTRNADFTNRAIRDNQQVISGAQAGAMNQAYGQAADSYQKWASLGQNAGQALGQIGQTYGGLGSLMLDKSTTGANIGTSLGNLGGQQASLGNILGNMGAGMAGLGDQYGTYGMAAQNQNWTDLSNLYGMGNNMQGYNQTVLDTAYNDWQSRWKDPAALAGGLTQMIPNYAGRVTPDSIGYTTPVADQNSAYGDLAFLLSQMGGTSNTGTP